MFPYENPYPGDLMHLRLQDHAEEEVVDEEASDVLSPSMPTRKLPLVSEGQRQGLSGKYSSGNTA